jgi:hypothetical protein
MHRILTTQETESGVLEYYLSFPADLTQIDSVTFGVHPVAKHPIVPVNLDAENRINDRPARDELDVDLQFVVRPKITPLPSVRATYVCVGDLDHRSDLLSVIASKVSLLVCFVIA